MRFPIIAMLKSIVVVLFLVGLTAGGYLVYSRLPSIVNQALVTPSRESVEPGQEVVVTIPKGASLSLVGSILQDQGVISSRLVFKLVALIRGEQRAIKAGDYALRTGSDAGDVLDQLISGKTIIFSLTIPEGYNIFQIADLFNQSGHHAQERIPHPCGGQGLPQGIEDRRHVTGGVSLP